MNPDVLSDGQKKWRREGGGWAVMFWRQGDSVASDGKVQSSSPCRICAATEQKSNISSAGLALHT